MATVTIKIETGNAAFHEGPEGDELSRILRKLSESWSGRAIPWIEDQHPAIMDSNGNRVGSVVIS